MKQFAVAMALALVWGCAPAQAQATPPEKAAEMLAHAWMIDNRCNVLGIVDRDLLTGFVARAELSLAEMKTVEAARKAIMKGRASGTAAVCDQNSARFVRDTLRVAKSATAGLAAAPAAPAQAEPQFKTEDRSAPVTSLVPVPQAAELKAAPEESAPAPEAATPDASKKLAAAKPAKMIAVAKPAKKVAAAKPAKKRKAQAKPTRAKPERAKPAPGALVGYAATAETYYRELRCRKRSFPAVNALYAKVLRQHQKAVAAGGKAAVRALLRAAESRASRGSC
jgi:hypothetical protein